MLQQHIQQAKVRFQQTKDFSLVRFQQAKDIVLEKKRTDFFAAYESHGGKRYISPALWADRKNDVFWELSSGSDEDVRSWEEQDQINKNARELAHMEVYNVPHPLIR